MNNQGQKSAILNTLKPVSVINHFFFYKTLIFAMMLKRAIAIFLLLFFLISNSGVAVGLHWCGGKLTSIEFFSDSDHNCKCGKRPMKQNCCKDKTLQLKANEDLAKINDFIFKISAPKYFFGIHFLVDNLPWEQYQCTSAVFYYPPPFKPKTPIYLLDRILLI